jgi:hypothetical protein
VAENLDNLFGDDFNAGELSTFTGSTLGECNGFDMGTGVDWNHAVTIYHSGSFFVNTYNDLNLKSETIIFESFLTIFISIVKF